MAANVSNELDVTTVCVPCGTSPIPRKYHMMRTPVLGRASGGVSLDRSPVTVRLLIYIYIYYYINRCERCRFLRTPHHTTDVHAVVSVGTHKSYESVDVETFVEQKTIRSQALYCKIINRRHERMNKNNSKAKKRSATVIWHEKYFRFLYLFTVSINQYSTSMISYNTLINYNGLNLFKFEDF